MVANRRKTNDFQKIPYAPASRNSRMERVIPPGKRGTTAGRSYTALKIPRVHLVFYCLLSFFILSVSVSDASSADDSDRKTTIVLGGDHHFPPSTFLKDGKAQGYMVDVTRAVAQSVGLEVDVNLSTWKTALEKLSRGELDVVVMSYSEKRAGTYEFSVQFALNSFGLMVKKDSDITGIKDITGRNILVQQGGVMRDYIKAHDIKAEFTYMEDVKTILTQMESNRFDGAFLSKKTGFFLARQLRITGLKFTRENINPRKTVFAVTRGNYELIQYLNEGLSIINSNGRLQAINEKWFGPMEENMVDRETIKKWGLRIGIGIVLVISLIFIWNRRLQAEINRRKKIETALLESEQRYRAIFNNSPMGIYVFRVESGDRLIMESANVAADQLTGTLNANLIGKSIEKVFPALTGKEIRDAYQKVLEKGVWKTENIQYEDNTIQGAFEVQAFQSSPGRFSVIFSNITERKSAEAERERLINSLQEALEEVKQLSGMLPICSTCKKIRDDNGYWNQVEAYLVKRTEARFSHGICPECAKKLYPDYKIYDE